MPPETLEEKCARIRASLLVLESDVRSIIINNIGPVETETFDGQRDEQKAHAWLSVRAIEDARMRLGKVIQFNGTGDSCFDA